MRVKWQSQERTWVLGRPPLPEGTFCAVCSVRLSPSITAPIFSNTVAHTRGKSRSPAPSVPIRQQIPPTLSATSAYTRGRSRIPAPTVPTAPVRMPKWKGTCLPTSSLGVSVAAAWMSPCVGGVCLVWAEHCPGASLVQDWLFVEWKSERKCYISSLHYCYTWSGRIWNTPRNI